MPPVSLVADPDCAGWVGSSNEYKLKGTPSTADWHSIHRHAHRVKLIALAGTIAATGARTAGTPNDTLYGTTLPERVPKLPGLSLCPTSLLSVNGQVSQLPQNIEGFLQAEDAFATTGQAFPTLTVVMLGYTPGLAELERPGQSKLSRAHRELIAKLSELQYIEKAIPLPNAWQTSLRVFAALRNLRNLALVLLDFRPDKFGKYAATVTDALTAIQAPHLRSLKAILHTLRSDANIKRMLDAAADFSIPEDVTLMVSAEDELSDNLIASERVAVVSGSAFAPLLRLKGFRSLTVSGNVGCTIDASSILSLMTRCPRLYMVCLTMNTAAPLEDAALATAEPLPKTNAGRVFELNDMSADKMTAYSTLTGGWEMGGRRANANDGAQSGTTRLRRYRSIKSACRVSNFTTWRSRLLPSIVAFLFGAWPTARVLRDDYTGNCVSCCECLLLVTTCFDASRSICRRLAFGCAVTIAPSILPRSCANCLTLRALSSRCYTIGTTATIAASFLIRSIGVGGRDRDMMLKRAQLSVVSPSRGRETEIQLPKSSIFSLNTYVLHTLVARIFHNCVSDGYLLHEYLKHSAKCVLHPTPVRLDDEKVHKCTGNVPLGVIEELRMLRAHRITQAMNCRIGGGARGGFAEGIGGPVGGVLGGDFNGSRADAGMKLTQALQELVRHDSVQVAGKGACRSVRKAETVKGMAVQKPEMQTRCQRGVTAKE
ncbi:hypothetical protein NM688_g3058 [Phlebia brevispora]|uniref:Uncharacterized protein n=1 Tax=Phlebia brevispora TaxID=194682 RepID=A0ACC1T6Y0_9APHY|nr:hypothetical protein NM688_g3058 [Phlebia brevispora]